MDPAREQFRCWPRPRRRGRAGGWPRDPCPAVQDQAAHLRPGTDAPYDELCPRSAAGPWRGQGHQGRRLADTPHRRAERLPRRTRGGGARVAGSATSTWDLALLPGVRRTRSLHLEGYDRSRRRIAQRFGQLGDGRHAATRAEFQRLFRAGAHVPACRFRRRGDRAGRSDSDHEGGESRGRIRGRRGLDPGRRRPQGAHRADDRTHRGARDASDRRRLGPGHCRPQHPSAAARPARLRCRGQTACDLGPAGGSGAARRRRAASSRGAAGSSGAAVRSGSGQAGPTARAGHGHRHDQGLRCRRRAGRHDRRGPSGRRPVGPREARPAHADGGGREGADLGR